MVMLSPLGTPETYFETGSSKRNFPSWTSSTITAAVIVLLLGCRFHAVSKCGRVEWLEICCGPRRCAQGARHGNHKRQDESGHDLTPWSCRRALIGPPTSGMTRTQSQPNHQVTTMTSEVIANRQFDMMRPCVAAVPRIAGMIAVVALCSIIAWSRVEAQSLKTLDVNVFPAGFILPLWVAQDKGLFARNGLQVRLIATPNSVQQMTGLIDGRFDLAMTAVDN